MIEFKTDGDLLILSYQPDRESSWVYERLRADGPFTIKKTFYISQDRLHGASAGNSPGEYDPVDFRIGRREGSYFEIDPEVLGIDFRLQFHSDIQLSYRMFVAEKNVSIFSAVNSLGVQQMIVGGDADGALPVETFMRLISRFPNIYELRKYVVARVSAEIRDIIQTKIDGEKFYRNYLNKKLSGSPRVLAGLFNEYEVQKYSSIRTTLQEMLANESSYSEAKWQDEILQILLLLYPKYIRAFKEVPVRDTYSSKNRILDYMLVDSAGHVDIVEIKQPFDKCIVSDSLYRDNHIPLRELSGTVMQVEKYIFYLNKWGIEGERSLTKKYAKDLPSGFEIRITNPSGIIIMGRSDGLSNAQKYDFEVVRRKYKNVIDIVTYDDLISRLEFTIEQLMRK